MLKLWGHTKSAILLPFLYLAALLFCPITSNGQGCKPQPNLGDVVSFCEGNSLTLNATEPNCSYLWSTGATTPTITVTSSGIFWVTLTNSCGSTTDSVHVISDPPLFINFGPDRYFCAGQNDTLFAPKSPSNTYLWSDGSTKDFLPISQTGTYWVSVSNSCNTDGDTITITEESPVTINLGPDIERCNTNPITLFVPSHARNIRWSTGHRIPAVSIHSPGKYWVSTSNSCGKVTDTITIINGGNIDLDLPDNANLCPGNSMTLTAKGGFGNYLWSTGSTNKSITVNTAGTFSVQYTNSCGTFYDTVQVSLDPFPLINLGPDTVVCKSSNYTLNAHNPGSTYKWNTGDRSQTLTIDSTGMYVVEVDNGCNKLKDSVYVEVVELPLGLPPQNICIDSTSGIINAGNYGSGTTYYWQHNGATTQKTSVPDTGNYQVIISNACGSVIRHVLVRRDSLLEVNLGPDTIICGNQYTLKSIPKLDINDSIVWNTGSADDTLLALTSGTYWVTVYNACGPVSDTIEVMLQKLPEDRWEDTVDICENTNAKISAPYVNNTHYLWDTGDTTHEINVSQSGWYWYTAFNYCDTIVDSIFVRGVTHQIINLGPDTVFCEPGVLVLDATVYDFDSIQWSTGSNNGVLPVTQSGTYWVEVYNPCGVYIDTIKVTVEPAPKKKLKDQSICLGQSATFSAQQNIPVSYQWNTGATSPNITATQQGWYSVIMTTDCGSIQDSAFLQVDSTLTSVDLGNDTIFCDGSIVLDPGYFEGASYKWSNGYSHRKLTISNGGTYWVRVSNSCNSVSDTINVLITGPPKLVLGNRVAYCSKNTLTLNAQNPGCTYLWNTGDSSQTLEVDTSGIFWVTITNDCGTLTDTVEVIQEYPLELELGNDTSICKGETVILNTNNPGVTTLWQDGSTNSVYTVTETGWYTVSISNTCGLWRDSIYVLVEDIPVFSLGPDAPICAIDGQLMLSGPPDMQKYLWNTGDTTQNINITTAGVYSLKVENNCFDYEDSILVYPEYPIDIDLGNDTILCLGENLTLDTKVSLHDVVWENGSLTASRSITSSGIYHATSTNACGIFSDTITVLFQEPLSDMVIDTTICRDDTLFLDLTDENYTAFWPEGDTTFFRKFWNEQSYPFYAYNACGQVDGVVNLDLSNCDCPFFIPNAFSPNNDGLNDVFEIKHSCDLIAYDLKIFNRWGQIVFESGSDQNFWTGKLNNKNTPVGTYIYTITYKWLIYGQPTQRKETGNIYLIR